MPREVYTPNSGQRDELKEEVAQLKEENELLKGCVMELAEAIFAE